ncbi:argininosuccinate lyase [Desulfobaculum xiamenense]|uniref:Argininosuccinate lyase n=1 Tax=Desulfobaculum xiamenense TaxID=995050 RepID=A0A846QK09_9BACT|nr:argininosuccinate lyase [Desulfobaculum xiamenense]NJB67457.1 argininosuccinate lyase [Desulfobaculum xiamenense]
MAETKMWGGRFAARTAGSVEEYTASEHYDRALHAEDIRGSIAHAHMMAGCGVLTDAEAAAIVAGLEQVREEIENGSFQWKRELEDVHMNIEARLTEIIGPLGGKLHTGRSRNDQVALDFRLHVTRRLNEWRGLLAHLVESLQRKADEHRATILPGCTHMQPAQPVSLAHHLLAYACMFMRDSDRAADCARRSAVSPLGAAALAGTTYPFNPAAVAEELGMGGVFANSMDAVSDRDFVIEAVFTGSMVMAHLSRLCEEIIIWSNPAFGFVKLPDAFATGSSIMPQKKNPDVAELMRGKTGRVYGSLTTLMTLIKGLPLAYNRDMQEDKEPFFDADRTVRASVAIMADMMDALGFDVERMRAACARGFLNATELADYLASKGMPFREAHHVTGAAVGFAERQGRGLEDLTIDELRQFSELIDEDVYEALAYETAVARRETTGGTGPGSVSRQIDAIRAWLDAERAEH